MAVRICFVHDRVKCNEYNLNHFFYCIENMVAIFWRVPVDTIFLYTLRVWWDIMGDEGKSCNTYVIVTVCHHRRRLRGCFGAQESME